MLNNINACKNLCTSVRYPDKGLVITGLYDAGQGYSCILYFQLFCHPTGLYRVGIEIYGNSFEESEWQPLQKQKVA